MIRLSIQTRQALSRLTLPLLIALSFALMIASRTDPLLIERLRATVLDRLAPVYALLHGPIDAVGQMTAEAGDLVDVAAENRRLRAENRDLRHWYDLAVALAAENAALRSNLHWLPDPARHFVTARVVADSGGIYGRSVLLAAGTDQGLRKGEIAIDADGLAGRISAVGARSARILLITDITSRVPVTLDGSHAAAMMVGANTSLPRLMYYPDDIHPDEGERVVTSSEADAYPAGLLVGTVHYVSLRDAVVVPAARLDRVDLLRIFDYGLSAIVPPDAPAEASLHARSRHGAPGPSAPGPSAPGPSAPGPSAPGHTAPPLGQSSLPGAPQGLEIKQG